MDNIETAPQGDADVTASSGQSEEVVTQPAETVEGYDEAKTEEAGTSTYPWEEDERFKGKTPDEIYKQIQESEKLKGQLSQKAELANMLEKTTGMNAGQIKDYLANQERQQTLQQVQANPELYNYQEIQNLKGQIALQNEEKELDKFLSSDEGKPYASFKDKILKLGLNLEKDKTYAEIAKDYFGESRAQGQQDAYKKIDMKQSTQATATSQVPSRGKLTDEEMDKMSAAELEAILPHADTSQRLY